MLRILKNEKYAGTLKQKKQITTDFLSHKRKTNEGEENYITIENNHAPIVDKEIFDRAQKELTRRRTVTVEKGRYSNRHIWSGKIKCAYCNSTFIRKGMENPDRTFWQCTEARKYGREKVNNNGQKVGCNCPTVHEQFLKANFLAVLDAAIANKDLVVRKLKDRVRQAIDESPNKGGEIKAVMADLEKIAGKKSKLIDMHLDGLIKRSEFEKAFAGYDKQEQHLRKLLSTLDSENKVAEDLRQKLDSIDQAIENLARLKEFGDSICFEVLAKVVVEGREKISFYLTAGKNENPVFFKIPPLTTQY